MPTNKPPPTFGTAPSDGFTPPAWDHAGSNEQPVALHPVVDVTSLRTLKLDVSAGRRADPPRGVASQAHRREVRDRLLYQACLSAKARADVAPDGALVSVAVASLEPSRDGLLEGVRRALLAADLPAKRLEVAFSEAAFVNASGQTKACFGELCRWGVALAVSDFGARYGSLTYLEHLDLASIRLDASFTRKLSTTLRNPHYPLAVIRGLLAVAEDLDVTVVASGIRTADDLRLLYSLGCSVQQGPFFTSAASETMSARGDLAGSKKGAGSGPVN